MIDVLNLLRTGDASDEPEDDSESSEEEQPARKMDKGKGEATSSFHAKHCLTPE